MPAQAYALVFTFMACSIGLGFVATRLLARAGGPTRRLAYVLPGLAGFGAFYLIGHKLGISVGPEIMLYGFQVALLGDLAIGLATRWWRRRSRRRLPEAGRRAQPDALALPYRRRPMAPRCVSPNPVGYLSP